ncbi:MAG: hypothetical protein JWO67_836 [Streptosporangiaceae bacterium]|nr:hypothetical protein [Streptosporangiaceae bacterium]
MAVTTSNLIQGPADLYSAPFGATEPADTNAAVAAPPTTPWVDCGGTDGGLKLAVDQKYGVLAVDQIVDRAGSRLIGRDFALGTNLAEATLANLQLALGGGGTVTTGTAPAASTFEPAFASSATQPIYSAFCMDGWAPGGAFRRRVILRKGLSTAKVESTYTKDKQTFIPVEFTGHYVTAAIAPIHVADQNI